jgi:hypothetical protein
MSPSFKQLLVYPTPQQEETDKKWPALNNSQHLEIGHDRLGEAAESDELERVAS